MAGARREGGLTPFAALSAYSHAQRLTNPTALVAKPALRASSAARSTAPCEADAYIMDKLVDLLFEPRSPTTERGRLMKIFRFGLGIWIFAFLLLLPSLLSAGDAIKQLSTTIDGFVPIISNTPREEFRVNGMPESARKLVLARFDFSEMTKRSLGQHWKSLNRGEQKQFVDAFTQWQLISYGRIVRSARGDEVQFNRELQDGKDVSVETKVVRRYSEDLPIDYWLHNVNGQWKVYNMVIDNVDIVRNVRAQFDRVIAKSSLQELLQRVKDQNSRS